MGAGVLPEQVEVESFERFVRRIEPRLREALSASVGSDVGRDATAEALAYAWEHWDRIRSMDNPVGYLFVLGRNSGRQIKRRRRIVLIPIAPSRTPWVEPGLPSALERLPSQQRVVVMLLYCFEWTMSEVAELLGVSKSTVQTHADRGILRLRRRMGVSL